MSLYEYAKSQNEASLRCAADTCHALTRDIEIERKRVRELEHFIQLNCAVDELIRLLSRGGIYSHQDVANLHQASVQQREMIHNLQAALTARKEIAEELNTGLVEASTALSCTRHDESNLSELVEYSDEDDAVTIITGSQPSFIPGSY
jgi:hypothetical protein